MQLGLRFGEGGEGVDAEEQGAGLGVVDVEDFDVYFHVWVEVAAEVAVDEFETAVGEFVGQQAAGEADFVVDGGQGGLLGVGVEAEVPFVGNEVGGADTAMTFNAVANHGKSPKKSLNHRGTETQRRRKKQPRISLITRIRTDDRTHVFLIRVIGVIRG